MWIGIPYTMLTFERRSDEHPLRPVRKRFQIDGAGPVRTFASITHALYALCHRARHRLPPSWAISTISTSSICSPQAGPFSLDYYQAGKTDLLVTWLYKLTVDQHDYALASTIGIFIFMIVSTLFADRL